MKILKEVLEFLEKEKVCVMATSHEGKTEAATMSFVLKEQDILMFTARSTRKYANLKENKNVSLVFSSKDYSKNAQVDGEAELLEVNKAKNIEQYMKEKRPDLKPHIDSREYGSIVFIVVKPKRIYFVDYSQKPMKEVLLE